MAYNDKFANMYVGDGLKTLANGYFTPTKLGDVQKEFAPSEDKPDVLVEQTEASVEQEKAYEDERSKNDGDSKDDKDEEEEADA